MSEDYDVFISHASKDEEIARLVQALFEEALGMSVYCTSDPDAIVPGTSAYREILDAHRSSETVIAIMTPNSIWRHWITFEAGGIHFRDADEDISKSLFLASAHKIKQISLPLPLRHYGLTNLCDKLEIIKLCRAVAERVNNGNNSIMTGENHSLVEGITRKANEGPKGWEVVKQVLATHDVSNSPFQFKNFLTQAETDIFLVGQSLRHFTQTDESIADYEQFLFQELRQRPISVRIMFSRLDCLHALKAWTEVTGERYVSDVRKTTRIFKRWMEKYRKEKDNLKGTLEIKVTKLSPLTLTFIDTKSDSAKLCLTPIANQGLSNFRPTIFITKNDYSDIFGYYLTIYEDIYADEKETLPINYIKEHKYSLSAIWKGISKLFAVTQSHEPTI